MSKATAFNAKWWDGNSVPSTGKLRVSFAYESSDSPGSIILRSSDNLAVAIAKEDLLEALMEILYPDQIILPVTSGEIITTSQVVPVIQTPEPEVVESVYDRSADPQPQSRIMKKKRKRRTYTRDHASPNSMRSWTHGEEETLIENSRTLAEYLHKQSGRKLLFDTTAKQLGRSYQAIRVRWWKFRKEGRV